MIPIPQLCGCCAKSTRGIRMQASNGSAVMRLLRTGVTGAAMLAGAVGAFAAQAPATAGKPLYKDAKAPIEARIDDLLSRMTLDEKLAQITAIWNRKAA